MKIASQTDTYLLCCLPLLILGLRNSKANKLTSPNQYLQLLPWFFCYHKHYSQTHIDASLKLSIGHSFNALLTERSAISHPNQEKATSFFLMLYLPKQTEKSYWSGFLQGKLSLAHSRVGRIVIPALKAKAVCYICIC